MSDLAKRSFEWFLAGVYALLTPLAFLILTYHGCNALSAMNAVTHPPVKAEVKHE